MSDRSWYCAYQGQQHGPYPDAQFREFIASGRVRADTLVWTDGMAELAKGRRHSGPVIAGRQAAGRCRAECRRRRRRRAADRCRSISKFWTLSGRRCMFFVGAIFIIPLPWVLVRNLRWLASAPMCRDDLVSLSPARRRRSCGGTSARSSLSSCSASSDPASPTAISFLVEIGLAGSRIQWFVANLASGRCSRWGSASRVRSGAIWAGAF